MGTQPLRERGRTLVKTDPDQLVWILSARESKTDLGKDAPGEGQVDHQLKDLRKFVGRIGGRIGGEVPEPNVSAFQRRRVQLPDGTFGYRVVRPDWEAILTALRRREANALAVVDIDRATRDPRILEDIIDVVELYGVYVVSMTGNIDLSTDAGVSSARNLVNQRNSESRNTSRRVSVGKKRAALEGKKHGGRNRSWGWRKDRETLNKRESKHIRDAQPRIKAGLTPLALAKEWNERGISTVTGVEWRAATIRNMFLRPRMAGFAVYRDEIAVDEYGDPVRGLWEPMFTDDEYGEIVNAWGPKAKNMHSRETGRGRGYRTNYLLSPFVRCGRCSARMNGAPRKNDRTGETVRTYRCPSKGQGGCGSVSRVADPIDKYITALVIAEHQRLQSMKVKELLPWPKGAELAGLERRIRESTLQYEAGQYPAEQYFPSVARMESTVAELRRQRKTYEATADLRQRVIANLAEEWKKPSFVMELKQAAIGKSLTAVVIAPVGKGVRFHPDQLTPIYRVEAA